MKMNLIINGKQANTGENLPLQERLAPAFVETYCEIMALADQDGPSLTLLKSSDRCMLMYLEHPEDSGFTSRNLKTTEKNEQRLLDFYLSNGQKDQYPYSWTVSIEAGLDALDFFLKTKGRSPKVAWNKD
jgi:hypothetical protein